MLCRVHSVGYVLFPLGSLIIDNHPGYFKNRMPLKPALGDGGRAYAASQTTVLHRKRLNQTESPIFVILCILGLQRQSFLTFILLVYGSTWLY